MSVQAQILELLQKLRDEFGIAVILVTHNLGVVAQIADRVMVMYAGRAVESGGLTDIFRRSAHPYTWGLLSSVPSVTGPALQGGTERLRSIGGRHPSPAAMPSGCRFHPRCSFVMDICRTVDPQASRPTAPSHTVACHLPAERRPDGQARGDLDHDGDGERP